MKGRPKNKAASSTILFLGDNDLLLARVGGGISDGLRPGRPGELTGLSSSDDNITLFLFDNRFGPKPGALGLFSRASQVLVGCQESCSPGGPQTPSSSSDSLSKKRGIRGDEDRMGEEVGGGGGDDNQVGDEDGGVDSRSNGSGGDSRMEEEGSRKNEEGGGDVLKKVRRDEGVRTEEEEALTEEEARMGGDNFPTDEEA